LKGLLIQIASPWDVFKKLVMTNFAVPYLGTWPLRDTNVCSSRYYVVVRSKMHLSVTFNAQTESYVCVNSLFGK